MTADVKRGTARDLEGLLRALARRLRGVSAEERPGSSPGGASWPQRTA